MNHSLITVGVKGVTNPLEIDWRHTRLAWGASLRSFAPQKRLGMRVARHSQVFTFKGRIRYAA